MIFNSCDKKNEKKKYLSMLDDEKYQDIFDTNTCIQNIINKEDPSTLEKQDIEFRNDFSKFY